MIYEKINIQKNIRVPRRVIGTKKILEEIDSCDYYDVMYSKNIKNYIKEEY